MQGYHSQDSTNNPKVFPEFSRRNCRQCVEQMHIY